MGIQRENLWTLLNYQPSEAQSLIHTELDKDTKVVVAVYGRQAGKTFAATYEAIFRVLQPNDDFGPPIVYVVSDTYSHSEKLYNQILTLFNTTQIKAFFDGSRLKPTPEIRTKLGGKIIFKSAENPSSLAGDTVSFCILEESSFIPDVAIKILLPALTPRQAQTLVIGTPDKTTNFFYSWYLKGQNPDYEGLYKSYNLPSWVNPKQDKAYIEKIVKPDIPEEDYRKYYLAEFGDSAETVFKASYIDRAVTLASAESPIKNAQYIAGLDLAQVTDYTVLTILKLEDGKYKMVHMDRWNGTQWDYTCQRVADICKAYNYCHIYLDGTAIGKVVTEILHKYYNNFTPVTFTQKSKADLVDNLRLLFEREEIQLYHESVLINECKAFKAIPTQKGISYRAPNGQHDDTVCSLMLATKRKITRELPSNITEGWVV